MKDLLKTVTAISPTLANTIHAALAWSGATRFIGNYGTKDPNEKVYLYLTSLATKVTASNIKPTTSDILNLLESEPEEIVIDDAAIARLKAAGETDLDGVQVELDEDHDRAMERHTQQLAHIEANRKAITEAIDKALNCTTVKTVIIPADLQLVLEDKIWEKVRARKTRLIVDIARNKFVKQNAMELGKINMLLKVHDEKAA